MHKKPEHDVYVSYASRDRTRALEVAGLLEAAGVDVWVDWRKVPGSARHDAEIAHAIANARVFVLIGSDAALRSHSVRHELLLAWMHARPCLGLLIEPVSVPEQIEGCPWIDASHSPPETWLPRVLAALGRAGVPVDLRGEAAALRATAPRPLPPGAGLRGLRTVARFTDQMWPIAHGHPHRGPVHRGRREPGLPQEGAQRRFRPGSRVGVAIEVEREGHLLLLGESSAGQIYCLCPSHIVPDTHLRPGRNDLPPPASRYDSFLVIGQPGGREHLLAIISEQPLALDWLPADPKTPVRVLGTRDVEALLERLRRLDSHRWTALATHFDVMA